MSGGRFHHLEEVACWFFYDPAVMCLSSVRQGGVAEDRAQMLHKHMGHPPLDLSKTCYPSIFGGIEVSQSS